MTDESSTSSGEDRSRDRRTGALALALGVAVLVVSVACKDSVVPVATSSSDDGPVTSAAGEVSAEATSDAAAGPAEDDVVGRAFTDMQPRADDGDLPPVVLDGFDAGRVQEMLDSGNPLVIGVPKREPFELAPGADPLDPNSYDWEKDKDGHWIISYYDLSLEEVDKELLLDALVYPEEYEGEDIRFPDRIRALDGEKVALTGYMIALRWKKDRLTHFMLVRDLKSCCFGQQPEADEWVDVPMQGKGAPYIQYVPVITRGTFKLVGSSDEAGYAVGAFQIEGTDVREE